MKRAIFMGALACVLLFAAQCLANQFSIQTIGFYDTAVGNASAIATGGHLNAGAAGSATATVAMWQFWDWGEVAQSDQDLTSWVWDVRLLGPIGEYGDVTGTAILTLDYVTLVSPDGYLVEATTAIAASSASVTAYLCAASWGCFWGAPLLKTQNFRVEDVAIYWDSHTGTMKEKISFDLGNLPLWNTADPWDGMWLELTGTYNNEQRVAEAPWGFGLAVGVSSWDIYLTPQNNAPTPEPASLVLLGTGLIGLAGVLRRKLSN